MVYQWYIPQWHKLVNPASDTCRALFMLMSLHSSESTCIVCLQEDVEAFMKQPENSDNTASVLRALDEQHNKYRFMDYNLATKKSR